MARQPVPGTGIVRVAACLLPPDARADWTAEWIGELHHRWSDRSRRHDSNLSTHLSLVYRALGALPDAFYLRRRLADPLILGSDLRYAPRTLVRRPALSVIIVATLALGFGATTAIFSVVNAVLLRAPSVRGSRPAHAGSRGGDERRCEQGARS